MLIRIGAQPGPAWMRDLSEGVVDPLRSRKVMKWFWLFFALFMLFGIGLSRFTSSGMLTKGSSYESRERINGLPLVSIGSSPRGVIAIGGQPTGVIAVGGLAVGVIAIGGLAVGGIALGGLSVGLLALAGLALGWRAVGGCALGQAALGGLAIGRYAYAGHGVAIGYDEASGKQFEKLIG
jgi:hypothetical protein